MWLAYTPIIDELQSIDELHPIVELHHASNPSRDR
jgi:hypothetical protein